MKHTLIAVAILVTFFLMGMFVQHQVDHAHYFNPAEVTHLVCP